MPKLNPFWIENRAQDTSKTLPRRPHDAPGRPKTPQDAPKTAPGRLYSGTRTVHVTHTDGPMRNTRLAQAWMSTRWIPRGSM